MSEVPSELKYTAEHEWIRTGAGAQPVGLGLAHYAQEALAAGVDSAQPAVGPKVSAGAASRARDWAPAVRWWRAPCPWHPARVVTGA